MLHKDSISYAHGMTCSTLLRKVTKAFDKAFFFYNKQQKHWLNFSHIVDEKLLLNSL